MWREEEEVWRRGLKEDRSWREMRGRSGLDEGGVDVLLLADGQLWPVGTRMKTLCA